MHCPCFNTSVRRTSLPLVQFKGGALRRVRWLGISVSIQTPPSTWKVSAAKLNEIFLFVGQTSLLFLICQIIFLCSSRLFSVDLCLHFCMFGGGDFQYDRSIRRRMTRRISFVRTSTTISSSTRKFFHLSTRRT